MEDWIVEATNSSHASHVRGNTAEGQLIPDWNAIVYGNSADGVQK